MSINSIFWLDMTQISHACPAAMKTAANGRMMPLFKGTGNQRISGGGSPDQQQEKPEEKQNQSEQDQKGRVKVEVVKETDKALLIQDKDGREGWIQKRWRREDGTVSTETFDKSHQEFKARKESRAAGVAWRNSFHQVAIARETEKAVAVEADVEIANLEKSTRRTLWIPKSVMKDGGVPGWILDKKVQEMKSEFPYGAGVIVWKVGGMDWGFGR